MVQKLSAGNPLPHAALTLRSALWSDAKAVAQLTHDACAAEGAAAHALSPEELRYGWRASGLNLERDTFVVETSGGRIVGYDELVNAHKYAVLSMDGYGHPEFNGRGIAEALLLHSFAEYYGRGTRTIGLGVDSNGPTGAQRQYQKVGMHPASASVTYEKELQTGRDPQEQ